VTGTSAVPTEAAVPRLLTVPAWTDRPRPTWDVADVVSHDFIGTRYHRLTVAAPSIAVTARAGQFVMVTVGDGRGGHLPLPRPMAIHRRHADRGTIEFIFDVVGAGTAALARAAIGDSLTVVGPLGNGFSYPGWRRGDSVLLVGRGIGVCGIMTVAEDARRAGVTPVAIFSGREPDNVIGMDDARQLGAEATAVDDRSGTSDPRPVRAALTARFAVNPPVAVFVCGSRRLGLLAAELGHQWGAPVSVSVESHMACGLGYCHGCALPSGDPAPGEGPLVCLDGPVFSLVWEAPGGAGIRF
jgi:dihydroorotate dehydrogenase electron transfer subunit